VFELVVDTGNRGIQLGPSACSRRFVSENVALQPYVVDLASVLRTRHTNPILHALVRSPVDPNRSVPGDPPCRPSAAVVAILPRKCSGARSSNSNGTAACPCAPSATRKG